MALGRDSTGPGSYPTERPTLPRPDGGAPA